MKPVFKCDYCSTMGTEEEIREHEPICHDNYDRKSCYTCIHKKGFKMVDSKILYECEEEKDIPAGCVYEFCPSYERKEKSNSPIKDIFGGIFNL